MTNSVTFPVNLGGDGSTVTDDDNASTGLGNGGHRTRFVPAMGQVVAVANTLTQRLADQSDTSTTSLAIATGSKSFVTAGFYEWAVGMYVVAASAAGPTNLMYGQVTSWTTATNTLVVNVLAVGGSGTYADWTVSLSGPPNLSTLPATIDVSSTSDALRVTQRGTGNALVVEDSANPDSTPFVIDAIGNVIIGKTTQFSGSISPKAELLGGTPADASLGLYNFNTTSSGAAIEFGQSNNATIGSQTVVASGDNFGAIRFSGSDGTSLIRGAQIFAQVDGTPGTNDMPGRLVFSTTADGASSPTERMRIDSAGRVGIGGTPGAGQTLLLNKNLTGATTAYGAWLSATALSDVTSSAIGFRSTISTSASAFTLATIRNFYASQGTIGAGSAITTQYGFQAESDLTGATNNYGFHSNIASGTGRWNFYAAGTAANYFAGDVTIDGNTKVKNYTETSYSANSSTAITLSLANGTQQYITLTGSPTITMPTAAAGKSFTLILYTGSGSYTVSWSTVAWSSGTTPTVTTTASKKDIFNFYSDGTNWYGSVFGQNF